MSITKDHVVTFHYQLTDERGTLIEDSHTGEPLVYLHGHAGIIPGLEQAMAGRAAGESFCATIPPEQAYGVRHDASTHRVQMKHVITQGKLRAGQVIAVNTEQGPRQVTVVKAGKFVVDVDTQHPLAGRTLTFAIDIVDVRDATAEERAHGHAHGPGGHHHH